MKKIFVPILLILLLTLLSACGGTEDTPGGENDSDAPAYELGLFERGVVENNIYTNDFALLSFQLPPGWEFATDAQLNTGMGIPAETAEDEEQYRAALSRLKKIRDMVAIDSETMNSVVVEFVNLSDAPEIDEAAYLADIKEKSNAFGEGTYTYTDGEDAVFGMNTFRTMRLLFQYEGLFLEEYYYVKRIDNFMLVITAGCGNGTDPYSFMHYFEE